MQELVFNALDINNSGTISFRFAAFSNFLFFCPMKFFVVAIAREWLLAVCICRKGTHDEKLAWTFRLYDTDGSGSIDFEEVTFLVDPC